MATVKYEGETFEFDEGAPARWSVQKALALGEADPAGFYGAIDAIFGGRSDEYAERLGDDSGRMLGLLDAVSRAVGARAKN